MKDHPQTTRQNAVWLSRERGQLEDLRRLSSRRTDPADWPHATEVSGNIPVYDAGIIGTVDDKDLMAEWATILQSGPGIVAIRQAIPDQDVIDRASAIFSDIIDQEKQRGAVGDHFAKPGANDRVWNALEKQCLADPANFAAYFSHPAIDMISRAWLGDAYQMTAQVNRVNPGGAAQAAHRDYHLGFMSGPQMERFPSHVHQLSPMLTLQGAVAHVDMPLESGPTLYLPYSQLFPEGYLAFPRPEFQAYFTENHVQLPLFKGDAVFFNPAVMHAAGTNRTTNKFRLGNLLQVSSCMGRAMETVNRSRMVKALYPALLARALPAPNVARVIAASAEGYAFPTNLDRDPPIGGLAPKTQAQIMAQALAAGLSAEAFNALVDGLTERQQA